MNDEHVALAKVKLAGPLRRTAELDRLADVLEGGEEAITMADALFRTSGIERRGLVVLTDRRLLCIDNGSFAAQPFGIWLSDISTVDVGASGGMGDARRGELAIVADDVRTDVTRIYPCERAAEIRAAVLDSLELVATA